MHRPSAQVLNVLQPLLKVLQLLRLAETYAAAPPGAQRRLARRAAGRLRMGGTWGVLAYAVGSSEAGAGPTWSNLEAASPCGGLRLTAGCGSWFEALSGGLGSRRGPGA